MAGLMPKPKIKPIVSRNLEDEDIQKAARESQARNKTIRSETLLTQGLMSPAAVTAPRAQLLGA